MTSEFEYVYVNQDGSARELSAGEREYLSKTFAPTDGARPYVKPSYQTRDAWGSISGFLHRSELPASIRVEPVNPNYDLLVSPYGGEAVAELREILGGETLEEGRRRRLERQRERERLARHPDATRD
jgi:hypothetical protein